MSDSPTEFNPYQPADPSAAPQGDPNRDPSTLARTVSELGRWQTFFAVLMTIGIAGLIVMMGFTMLTGQNAAQAIGGLACAGGAILLIYGLPAIMLWKAATGARRFARSPDLTQLNAFTTSQLAFWRTVGIIAALVLGLYAVILVVALVFGLAAAVGG